MLFTSEVIGRREALKWAEYECECTDDFHTLLQLRQYLFNTRNQTWKQCIHYGYVRIAYHCREGTDYKLIADVTVLGQQTREVRE